MSNLAHISRQFEPWNGVFPTIDPSVYIHESAVIMGDVRLAKESSVWPNSTLRGDEGEIVVGEGTNIQDGTTVHMTHDRSTTHIGSRVTIGHNCLLHGCIIEEECLIGMGSIVMDNARIGRGSFIGAGTLITADKVIPPNSLVWGNPMRIIRQVNEKERAWIQSSWKHYADKAKIYLAQRSSLKR